MNELKTHLLKVGFFLLVLLSQTVCSYALQSYGSEVHYSKIDSLKYRVDFVFYRSCNGADVTNNINAKVVCNTAGISEALKPTYTSGEFLNLFCDNLGNQCGDKLNTANSGKGVVRLVYSDTVDFTLAPFQKFLTNGCKDVRFEFQGCCRLLQTANLATGTSLTEFYNYAQLDISEGNTSPNFSLEPNMQLVLNQPVQINLGALDSDGDSLSYRLAHVLKNYTDTVANNAKFTYSIPFDVYYPGSLKPPYANPYANPPIGIYIDAVSGQLTLTPTGGIDYPSVVVIEVTEWRHVPGKSKAQVVGVTRREWTASVIQSQNFPPTLTSEWDLKVCRGEKIVIDVKSEDQIYKPPPPQSSYVDTTSVDAVTDIPGAKVTEIDTSREKSLNIEWTPDSSSVRDIPYTIYVSASDDRCPYQAHVTRVIKVEVVEPQDTFSLYVDSIGCGTYKVSSSYLDKDTSNYYCEVSVESDVPHAMIEVFGGYKVRRGWSGLVKVNSNGTYVIKYKVGVNETCFETVSDTFIVNDMANFNISSDTSICNNITGIDLTTWEHTNSMGGDWKNLTDSSSIDSTYYFTVAPSPFSKKHDIRYRYTNPTSGCVVDNQFGLLVIPISRVVLEDLRVCQSEGIINLRQSLVKNPVSIAGVFNWDCIDCGSNEFDSLLVDYPDQLSYLKELKISSDVMDLGSKAEDSIRLKLNYFNSYGCLTEDTALITIVKQVTPSYMSFRDVCWNEGIINLEELGEFKDHTTISVWKAIDSVGFNPAQDFQKVLNSRTFNTLYLPQPTTLSRYLLRRTVNLPCQDTVLIPLNIRNFPKPQINASSLQKYSAGEPFAHCDLDEAITLNADLNGGRWSSFPDSMLVGNTYYPSMAKSRQVQKLYYVFTDSFGCAGSDSVSVVVHPQHQLKLSNDTALTWYTDQMEIRSSASYENTSGVYWLPLTGGTIDKVTNNLIDFSFTTSGDSIFRHLLYCQTLEVAHNVCPFMDATQQISIHPSPCMDIKLDYDGNKQELTATPMHRHMASYSWQMGELRSNDSIAVFDVSGFTDGIQDVWLTAINQLGDSCKSIIRFDPKTGSINDVLEEINVYPNPTSGIIYINSTNGDITNVIVLDQLGKVVLSEPYKPNGLDCSSLATGLYQVRIFTSKKVYVTRMVKE